MCLLLFSVYAYHEDHILRAYSWQVYGKYWCIYHLVMHVVLLVFFMKDTNDSTEVTQKQEKWRGGQFQHSFLV